MNFDDKTYVTKESLNVILDDINSRLNKLQQQSALSSLFDGIVVSRLIDFTQPTYESDVNLLCGDVNRVKAFSGRRRCNLADDGTVNAYFGDSAYKEDGTNGQVMVEQPKFYYKVEPLVLEKNTQTNGKGYHIRKAIYSVSDYQLPGFKLHPAFKNESGNEVDYIYIGAYEGCLHNGTTYILDDAAGTTSMKLSSVVNAVPASGQKWELTRKNAETCAKNRGTGWHIETVQIISATQLLFMIEYGVNSQMKFANGIAFGTDPNTNINCSAKTGSTRNIGNGSGRASISNMISSGTTYSNFTAPNRTSISYRGMENPYGNIWKFIAGITSYGVETNISEPYICNSFTFTEDTITGYTGVGFTCPESNYISAFGYGSDDFDWLLMGSETKGNSKNTIGDYQYQSTSTGFYRIARLGGGWAYGPYAGLFFWGLDSGSGNRYRNISARICYLPQ